MSAVAAFAEGWRRVRRAPAVIAGLWLATLLTAAPAAIVLRASLADHLGASLAAETAASGVNFDWWNEYLAQASGLGHTFAPSILGFAAVLRNVSAAADGGSLPGIVALIVAVHLGLSLFLLGGVLDRLARDRRVGAAGFFAACGVYFFRFLRLAVPAGLAYLVLFRQLHPWLLEDLYSWWTRDLTVERSAFVIRAALYVAFALCLAAVNLVVDYAKIRMVVEDRRSAIGALAGALRFVRRHPARAAGVYLLNTLAFVAVLAAYFFVAPGASGVAGSVVATLFIGQFYIAARLVVRLAFAASQIALFQGSLAHAGYVARPAPRWPDSPAIDALGD